MPSSEHADLLLESAEELYEHAPNAYFSSALDGMLVKVNETLLRWTGHRREELIGRLRIHDLLPPGARIYYETHYAPLLHMQGEVSEIAVELLRADGSRMPVLLSSTLVRDEQGVPHVVRTTATDASERRRYERELLRARAEAESRARAALAIAHVAEGIVLVGERGTVELLNPAAEAILHVSAGEVVGRPVAEALAGWDDLSSRVAVARSGERLAPEILPSAHDGVEQWVAVSAVDAGGAVVYTLRDVTAERDLDQIRADIVAIVSHELRTPLTGAYGAAQTLLARSDTLDEAQQRLFLELIAEQLGRLAAILDQILLASRLDRDALLATTEDFDARDVVDTVLRAVHGDRHGRLVVDVPAGIHVCADLDRLRQVVLNLVDNALKYSDGLVRIGVAERGSVARITVSDDGPGIPSGDRERVFQKFFRLDPNQQAGVGGTGLGLYIARELVQRMGGRIGYLERPRGATFFVDVPLA